MGARSGLYAGYYLLIMLVFLGLTIFQWAGLVPLLTLCSTTCGVQVFQPILVEGTPGGNCVANLSDDQYYANGCFLCSGDGKSVLWPCPASTGIAGCSAGSVRLANTCIGTANASTLTGVPIVSSTSTNNPDLGRCAAAIGTPARATDGSVCAACISSGGCVDAATFNGAGMFLSGVRWALMELVGRLNCPRGHPNVLAALPPPPPRCRACATCASRPP